MPIIDTTYFFGPIAVPQLDQATVVSNLNLFINKYEDEYLKQVLGYKLSKLFQAGVLNNTQIYIDIRDGKEYTDSKGLLQKWEGLKYAIGSAKISPIANFVFYHYVRSKVTTSTGTGQVVIENQNSVPADSAPLQRSAWNEMVKMNLQLRDFLIQNSALYPDFEDSLSKDVFRAINSLNL